MEVQKHNGKINLAEVEAQVDAYRQQLLSQKAGQSVTPPPLSAVEPVPGLKLDLGCGKFKKPGFIGVDRLKLDGVDQVVNFCEVLAEGTTKTYAPWPWADNSVDEVNCSHTIEHLKFTPEEPERIHFVNELWRILKPGAKALIVVPHYASCRFWGDYTHRGPVSEFWPPYLSKKWREDQAPHNDLYKCDFDCTQPAYGGLHPLLETKNAEWRELALTFGREAAGDMIFTLIAKK